jgi:hypothetical protein
VPLTKKKSENPEPTFGTIRQDLIDKYRSGHFDTIHNLEKIIEQSVKLSKQTENPRELKTLRNLIKKKKKELWKLKKKTAEVLRNAEIMQKKLK